MNSVNPVEYYASHSGVTDPGDYVYLYENMPSEAAGIVKVVQGVILNLAQIENENIPIPDRIIHHDINLKTVRDILANISGKDNRMLIRPRPLEKRTIGICAHYALLTCSILRYKGIPARCRGGFEMYVNPEKHHDHWICEYWNAEENRWIRIDPEINDAMREHFKIHYNSLDLPADVFMPGVEAWTACRSGKLNPAQFGIMGNSWEGGWDFVLCEAVLDFKALNKSESLPWTDTHLSQKGFDRLTGEEITLLDNACNLALADNNAFAEMHRFYENNKELKK